MRGDEVQPILSTRRGRRAISPPMSAVETEISSAS
jgi:hypothetical protein